MVYIFDSVIKQLNSSRGAIFRNDVYTVKSFYDEDCLTPLLENLRLACGDDIEWQVQIIPAERICEQTDLYSCGFFAVMHALIFAHQPRLVTNMHQPPYLKIDLRKHDSIGRKQVRIFVVETLARWQRTLRNVDATAGSGGESGSGFLRAIHPEHLRYYAFQLEKRAVRVNRIRSSKQQPSS